MDVLKFSQMLSDKHITNFRKLKYKYPNDFEEFINVLKSSFYKKLPLNDFDGESLVYLTSCTGVNLEAVKLLFTAQKSAYAAKAVEEEIVATSAIESIDFDRSSVRSIMRGNAPKDSGENRIYGLKRGFDFISDRRNHITEKNIHKLYMMAIGDFLEGDDRLRDGNYYRHDDVYVMSGDSAVHRGIGSGKLSGYMKRFVDFANADDGTNDLLKAAILHFDIAYLHPYFDGNGRMARLLHMWFLIQRGYESTLFVPMSSYIEKSREKYYDAYTLVENNARLAGVTDVTPFLMYFIKHVYDEMKPNAVKTDTAERYDEVLRSGEVTVKEAKLWQFVLSTYGGESFTTKQLEKDFGDAAFATVRKFVLKFSEFGLLDLQEMKNKVIYRIR